MPSKTTSNSIQFPATNAIQEASLNRLLDTMAEFMDVILEVEKVTFIQVTVPEDRPDVLAVLLKVGILKSKKLSSP